MNERTSAFPPDFLILGAQKCGTTSLASALRKHPDVFVPTFKEARHFGFVENDEVGGSKYQSFFSDWGGQPVVGEATPEYLATPRSAEQITRHLPQVKAIVQLRNPIDRAYSAYWHGLRGGFLSEGFTANVEAEFASGHTIRGGFHDTVRRGQYAEQLQCYFDAGFDRDRMLILEFEEVLSDPSGSLRTVQEFLGIDAVITEFPHQNSARVSLVPRRFRLRLFKHWQTKTVKAIHFVSQRSFTPPPMDPEVRTLLIDHFRPWNERLSELLGRDFSMWDR